MEHRQWGQNQMAVALSAKQRDADVIAWMAGSHEKLQSLPPGASLGFQKITSHQGLFTVCRACHHLKGTGPVRVTITDVFEHMLGKGKHCSNAFRALTCFILTTSLRGTDEETEAQSNQVTLLA